MRYKLATLVLTIALPAELACGQAFSEKKVTTEVMPVIQIDERTIGKGIPGPLTRMLQQAFQKLTRA